MSSSKAEKDGQALSLTHQENKLLDSAIDIFSNPPDLAEDMAFTHAIFCQVGLPRSKVDGREFMRQSGAAWVNVQAGYLDEGRGPVQQPIPYGALPRLALAHVSTYAVRNKAKEIPIGDSAAQFLNLMGMGDDGRRYASLRKQMHALAACRLQIGYKGRTFNGQAVEQFDAWLANKDTGQRALWPGLMVLSDHFYNSLIESAVPVGQTSVARLERVCAGPRRVCLACAPGCTASRAGASRCTGSPCESSSPRNTPARMPTRTSKDAFVPQL